MKTALRALLAVTALAATLLAGCSQPKPDTSGTPVKEPFIPGPPIADVAAKYNKNADLLRQLFAPVTVRIAYTDSKGERHNEQGEGRLQLVQPDHVAMSVGKIGETYFWLGSDSQQYWWADLSGKPRQMFVGAHVNYNKSQARKVGVVVAPLDLVRLLGIVSLPDNGVTQFSADRKRIGVTTTLPSGTRQRTWIDATTYLATKIELYNTKGECEIVADLSEPGGVDIKGRAERPWINTRVIIVHAASNSEFTLDLSEMQDGAGRMVAEAFDEAEVAKHLRVEKTYDLDTPPKPASQPNR